MMAGIPLWLILLCVIVLVGVVLYAEHRMYLRRHKDDAPAPEEPAEQEEECCGLHMTCERDSLLAAAAREIEYYDDEELDRFAGRAADAYTAEESEEFRDILLSMQPDDIAGWARSLQLRNVALPADVRDELIMIVAEERQNRTARGHAAIS